MENTVSCAFNTSSEAVVFTVIVVVTHLARFWFFLDFDFSNCLFLLLDVVSHWTTTLVFDGIVWLSLLTVLALGDVDLSLYCRLFTDKLVTRLVVVSTLWLLVCLITNDFGLSLVVVASVRSVDSDVEVGLIGWLVISRCLVSSVKSVRGRPIQNGGDSPLSAEIYFGKSGGLLTVLELGLRVLAFLELIWESAAADASLRFFDDTEIVGTFFSTGSLVVAAGLYADGLLICAESSIFPSDALGGSPLDDFPFYPGLGGSFYGSSVTPVR